uniref:Uncharacterized protein n=2 Tax=Ceratitis capitata TaxID=7213 RepID=W8AGZ5_CERCA
MTAMESYKREQQQRQLQQQMLREQREKLEQLTAQQEAADTATLLSTSIAPLLSSANAKAVAPITTTANTASQPNGVGGASIVAVSGAAASATTAPGADDTAANSSQADDSASLVPSGGVPRPPQMMIAPGEVAELRRQVALENLQNQRMDNLEQDVPVEFECCFCTTKNRVCVFHGRGYTMQRLARPPPSPKNFYALKRMIEAGEVNLYYI